MHFFRTISLVLSVFLSCEAFAAESPLCKELAAFSCAPGTFNDGTGEIKSESKVQGELAAYATKMRAQIEAKLKQALEGPENEYFKSLAEAGLGLSNSPQCTSADPQDVKACRENLLEGLTALAQKQVLGPLVPFNGLQHMGPLEDVNNIVSNNKFKRIVKELGAKTKEDFSVPVTVKRIETKIFPEVRALIIERVKSLDMPDSARAHMIRKLNGIEFDGSKCTGDIMDGAWGMLEPNALYKPERNDINICSGFLLQSNSEFQIAIAVAHELTHAIDPCLIAYGPAGHGFKYSRTKDSKVLADEYPIKNLISCLRRPDSVEAQVLVEERKGESEGSRAGKRPPRARVSRGSVNRGPPSVASVSSGEEKPFCSNDQIGESVSDWMASEVVPKYIAKNFKLSQAQYQTGYSNAYRLLCKDGGKDRAHPGMESRVNKIVLANPQVRAQMGCSEKHSEAVYCDPANPPPPLPEKSPGVRVLDEVSEENIDGVEPQSLPPMPMPSEPKTETHQ